MKELKRIFKRLKRFFETDRWLFLDDTREPPIHLKRIFYIVRDYDDFVEYIETYGIPEIISFDHDLNLEHTNFFFENGGFRNPPDPRYEIFKFKTGYDCALWLIDYCKRNNKELKKVFVHVFCDFFLLLEGAQMGLRWCSGDGVLIPLTCLCVLRR